MANKEYKLRVVRKAIVMIAGVLVGLSSCDYKDLDEPDYGAPSFTLRYEFDNVDSIPRDFLVVFYPVDENMNIGDSRGYFVREVNKKSAVINGIPAGQYKITTWNKDLYHTRVDINSDRNKTVAYAQQYMTTSDMPVKVLDSIYYGQVIYDVPDYMVHANTEFFELLNWKEDQELVMHPDSMVITIELRLHGIASLGMAKQIKASLNNVAKYRYPAFDNCTEDTCTVLFDCGFSAADSLVYADFNVFGVDPTKQLPHLMVLFFWLNGNNIFLPIDVTDAFLNYIDGKNRLVINIPDLNIDLKDFIPASGTFEINVNGWENVEQEIYW